MASKDIEAKTCYKCKKIVPMTSFYPNRDWSSQGGRDIWCKSCVQEFCVDEETILEYMRENNRKVNTGLIEAARLHDRSVTLKSEYKKARNIIAKKKIMDASRVKYVLNMMNNTKFYEWEKTTTNPEVKKIEDLQGNKAYKEIIVEEATYRDRWVGIYTDTEAKYLEDYVEKLGKDFDLNTSTLVNYAEKIAKASLDYDNARMQVAAGAMKPADLKIYKQIFDELNTSAQFTPKSRGSGVTASGFNSFAEIVAKIEETGMPIVSTVRFPIDDVDKITENFYHIVEAIGMRGDLSDG